MSAGDYLSCSFIFVNLGCEMIYILHNRLKAQKIDPQKGNRIIDDITTSIFSKKFMEELVQPQQALTVNNLKDMFKKLAHTSIMKLDSNSMEKLFYLMLITVKKQFILTSSPLELYTLTINHLQSIKSSSENLEIKIVMNQAISIWSKFCTKLSFMQYFWIKEQILSILQGYQTRIVTFIESGYQTEKGCIILFQRNTHNIKSLGTAINHPILQFNHSKSTNSLKNLSYEQYKAWNTELGQNYFENPKIFSNTTNNFIADVNMKDLLGLKNNTQDFSFTLDMFKSNQREQIQVTQSKNKKVDISTANNVKNKIEEEFGNLDMKGTEEQIDLLAMMDNQ